MRQSLDHANIVEQVNRLYEKLDQPATKGDLLKLYAALSLNQELILDAMTALSAMVTNDEVSEKYNKFGETFNNTNSFITKELQALIRAAKEGVDDE
ncbi:hypothetical protein [Agrobacterium sp. M50-1]|uniref:hypothetical protein n=1 Tax=Agrobacterium sp. M50-1 TaxID=3132821 RepID=UPI003CE507F5